MENNSGKQGHNGIHVEQFLVGAHAPRERAWLVGCVSSGRSYTMDIWPVRNQEGFRKYLPPTESPPHNYAGFGVRENSAKIQVIYPQQEGGIQWSNVIEGMISKCAKLILEELIKQYTDQLIAIPGWKENPRDGVAKCAGQYRHRWNRFSGRER